MRHRFAEKPAAVLIKESAVGAAQIDSLACKSNIVASLI